MTDAPSPLRPAAPGSAPRAAWPTMLETRGWEDYALLDFGLGRKLERYGDVVVDRPEPQAMGRRHLSDAVLPQRL